MAIRFASKQGSTFKKALKALKPGDSIEVSDLDGDFIVSDSKKQYVFIAGGIGVTPFRSMMQDMINRRDERSVVMLYGNNSVKEIAYSEVFDRAERELGIRTVYAVVEDAALDTNMHHGFIDAALIQREVPDYQNRTFYISGPRSMVLRFQGVLKELGITRSRIKVDFFPGFA